MPSSTTPHPQAEHPESDLDINKAFYRAILHELMNTGIGLARALELTTVNAVANGDTPSPDTPLAFERIARAIRRSIMLALQLNEPQPPAPAPQAETPEPPAPEHQDKDRPEHQHSRHPERPQSLAAEAKSDLSLADEAPTNHPIAEQIAAIRRDLGLPPAPNSLEPAPLASALCQSGIPSAAAQPHAPPRSHEVKHPKGPEP